MKLALLVLLAAAPALAADALDGRFKKASALIESDKYDAARHELDAALEKLKTDDPRMVRYHERTGASFLREGKIKEARVSFTAAVKATLRLQASGDDAARAYTGMGICLRRSGNDAYAKRFFQKAAALKPDEGTKMFIEDQIREIEGKPPTL